MCCRTSAANFELYSERCPPLLRQMIFTAWDDACICPISSMLDLCTDCNLRVLSRIPTVSSLFFPLVVGTST